MAKLKPDWADVANLVQGANFLQLKAVSPSSPVRDLREAVVDADLELKPVG